MFWTAYGSLEVPSAFGSIVAQEESEDMVLTLAANELLTPLTAPLVCDRYDNIVVCLTPLLKMDLVMKKSERLVMQV